MPSIPKQMALGGRRTNPGLVAARFLLKPGRSCEEAVKSFRPYSETQEVNPEARMVIKVPVGLGSLPTGHTNLLVQA